MYGNGAMDMLLSVQWTSIKTASLVVRGGSWHCSTEEFSLGMRDGRVVERGFVDVGFRLVRNVDSSLSVDTEHDSIKTFSFDYAMG